MKKLNRYRQQIRPEGLKGVFKESSGRLPP
jgi:hypothetical protein